MVDHSDVWRPKTSYDTLSHALTKTQIKAMCRDITDKNAYTYTADAIRRLHLTEDQSLLGKLDDLQKMHNHLIDLRKFVAYCSGRYKKTDKISSDTIEYFDLGPITINTSKSTTEKRDPETMEEFLTLAEAYLDLQTNMLTKEVMTLQKERGDLNTILATFIVFR